MWNGTFISSSPQPRGMASIDASILDDVFPERADDAHKGDFGRLLVVAGAHRFTNTPAIVALGALRTGIDLVDVAAPERAADTTATFALNLLTAPLPGKTLRMEHVDTLLERAGYADAAVIGPGLMAEDDTLDAVEQFLRERDIPAVIDADALRVAGEDTVSRGDVLTPHSREFERLTGSAPPKDGRERTEAVQGAAERLGCTVVLKGPTDILSDGDRLGTNATGNPSMTRGGTGDVLAGIAGALLAGGTDGYTAASAAAYLNGVAGDRVLGAVGEAYLLEELLDRVASVVP